MPPWRLGPYSLLTGYVCFNKLFGSMLAVPGRVLWCRCGSFFTIMLGRVLRSAWFWLRRGLHFPRQRNAVPSGLFLPRRLARACNYLRPCDSVPRSRAKRATAVLLEFEHAGWQRGLGMGRWARYFSDVLGSPWRYSGPCDTERVRWRLIQSPRKNRFFLRASEHSCRLGGRGICRWSWRRRLFF